MLIKQICYLTLLQTQHMQIMAHKRSLFERCQKLLHYTDFLHYSLVADTFTPNIVFQGSNNQMVHLQRDSEYGRLSQASGLYGPEKDG
jgi:hypothetical protein